MPENDREVFAYFQNDPELTAEVALLAYASYAQSKYDWSERFVERHGREPGEAEINEWIASLPERRLNEIRELSFALFDRAAQAYLTPQIEAAKEKAVEQSIHGEVKRIGDDVRRAVSFWSTFGPNLFIGVVASIAFSLIVILLGWILERDPSPFAIYKHLRGGTEQTAPQ